MLNHSDPSGALEMLVQNCGYLSIEIRNGVWYSRSKLTLLTECVKLGVSEGLSSRIAPFLFENIGTR